MQELAAAMRPDEANYTEALRLYQQAASHGHVASRRMLELIYSRPAQGGGAISRAWRLGHGGE